LSLSLVILFMIYENGNEFNTACHQHHTIAFMNIKLKSTSTFNDILMFIVYNFIAKNKLHFWLRELDKQKIYSENNW